MSKKTAALIAGILLLSLPFIYARISPRLNRNLTVTGTAMSDTANPPVSTRVATATSSPPAEEAQLAGRQSGGVYYQNKVVVLIYHHIDTQEAPGLVISPERFASHLDMLAPRGYHVITLKQLLDFLEGGPIPDNAVLITFNDGYESVHQYAFPELAKRHMPAVAFAIVKYVGQKLGNLQHYSWDEAREMAAAGITTQSHTYNLHSFALLANGKNGPLLEGPLKGQSIRDYRNMVYQDLKRSREEIENHLQQPVYALALPFGSGGQTAIQAAADAGFKLIFTTHYGVVTRKSNPQALPRVNAGSPLITPAKLDALIRAAAGTNASLKEQPTSPHPHTSVATDTRKTKRL